MRSPLSESGTTLSPEQIRERYNRQAVQYQTRYVGLKGEYYQRFEDNIFLELLDVDHKRVLDLGTGRGRLALLLASRAREIVGIDLSDEMIRFAREAATGIDNVTFEQADAAKLNYPDKHFDAVSSMGMFPYVRDVLPFFREINRVLVDGGTLAFSASNAGEWTFTSDAYERLRSLGRRLRGRGPAGPREPSPLIPHDVAFLTAELAKAGFELVTYRSTFFFVPSRVFYRAGRLGMRSLQRFAARTNDFLGKFPVTREHGKVLVICARKVRDVHA